MRVPDDLTVPTTALIEAPELEVLEDAVGGLPLRIDRLTATPGGVRLSSMTLPRVSIATGATALSIRSCGEVVGDTLVVGVPLTEAIGSWNGVSLTPRRAWLYRPGAEHEGVAAKPPWWGAVTVDRTAFSESDAERLFGGSGVEVFESPAVARVADLIRAADADVIDGGSPSLATRFSDELVDALAALGDGEPRLASSAAARLVEDCEALASELGPIPTVQDLAEAVGTSDRWVRSAFSQTYGVAPSDYFRARALADCRRELDDADPAATTVTEVAFRWGFRHLGRFSARYRTFFGESPSTTLHRR